MNENMTLNQNTGMATQPMQPVQQPVQSVQRVTREVVQTAHDNVTPDTGNVLPYKPQLLPQSTVGGTTNNTTTNNARDSHDVININISVANGSDIDDAFVKELMQRIKKEKELQDIYKYK